MSDVELQSLKSECEKLRSQLINNSQGFQTLLSQIEAYKGELTDARTISFQLRLNLGAYEIKTNAQEQQLNNLQQQVKNIQAKLDEMNAKKSNEVSPKELKGKPNKT